ncbi:MAG: hypothetical protein CME88_09940 [Hirschia sp.]|nr:hypothetical protein [Hirschia sp.]MBF18688.1 hypothetical protein [Hirschia sp.]|tara:strand:+ start:46 stop:339 length:294 start_codon:yes stop_codon:yes gene_type:complete
MKQRFNGIAPETYRDQQRRLEQRAREIEKQLNTPPAPQPQLRPPPGTAMRMQGDQAGRDALKQNRIDMKARLEAIKQDRIQAKPNEHHQTNNKGKSL